MDKHEVNALVLLDLSFNELRTIEHALMLDFALG